MHIYAIIIEYVIVWSNVQRPHNSVKSMRVFLALHCINTLYNNMMTSSIYGGYRTFTPYVRLLLKGCCVEDRNSRISGEKINVAAKLILIYPVQKLSK